MPTTLYIIGNGFDLMHGMHTRYSDFLRWLLEHNHFDVVFELESVFGNGPDHSNLWCDFETALGQYDFEKAATWDMTNLYVSQEQVGNINISSGGSFFLDVSLNAIVDKSFSSWVRCIEMANEKKANLDQDAIFLTFNYTETLEYLYNIKLEKVLHIHGCRMHNEKLIVGHRNYIDPTTAWKEGGYLRDNNERVQHICDMNELYKPVESIIGIHQDFWSQLQYIEKVVVLGHSCNEIDYLYYEKVIASIPRDTQWIFYYHTYDDRRRMQKMAKQFNLTNYATTIQ